MESKKCPKCGAGYKIKDNEKLPDDCVLDFWLDNDGNFNWTCFECEHTWKEKAK